MTARTLHDRKQSSVETHPGALRPSDASGVLDAGLGMARSKFDQAIPDASDLRRELAASQQELGAALRQIDALLTQGSLLRRKVLELAQAVAQAREFAHRDALTGLPDRRLLLERFNQAVALAARQHRQVALLFLDLDEFRFINNALGHVAGDSILQEVATRLAACIRSSDTACRYGGDEFVILLAEFEGQESAAAVAEKIRARLAAPYVVDGATVELTTSFGMAVYPVDGHEYRDLLKASDLAMYRNKASGPASPTVSGAARADRGRINGTDLTKEHHHETRPTQTNVVGEEVRSVA
jgi:diguanylate cyclase (GGDEF)-like protein